MPFLLRSKIGITDREKVYYKMKRKYYKVGKLSQSWTITTKRALTP